MEPIRNRNVPAPDVAEQMRAALRMFQSRRMHTCPGCGRVLGQRDEVVRVIDLVYHESCAPQSLRA